jgi:septal ring factor EnvC (AmiA/AmiB activator)
VEPELTPPTPARATVVTCPSCRSEYNPETRELVKDTQLQARIRELEKEIETWREACAGHEDTQVKLRDKLQTLEAQLAAAAADKTTKSRNRDFIVASR